MGYNPRNRKGCDKYYCEFHTCSNNSCILEDYGHVIVSTYGDRFESLLEACERGTRWFEELRRVMESGV